MADRHEVDSMLESLQHQLDDLRAVQDQLAAATGRGRSRDGLVDVVVNSGGVLQQVSFAPDSFSRTTPEALSRSVAEAAAQASRALEQQVAALTASLDTLPDLSDIIPGAPSLRGLRPHAPAAPEAPAAPVDDDQHYGRPILREGW